MLVIVVRYFGGTMLGAGGLVRAYGQCARDVLSHAPTQQQEVLHQLSFSYTYDDVAVVMQCVEKFSGHIVSQKS